MDDRRVERSGQRVYGKGEAIVDHGDEAEDLFIISRGTVVLSVATPDGSQKVIKVLKSGDVFGEEVLAPELLRHSRRVAHEESWMSTLGFNPLLEINPAISRFPPNVLGRSGE